MSYDMCYEFKLEIDMFSALMYHYEVNVDGTM